MIAKPFVVIVAGVSGSGKTTVGRLLAARMAASWLEGDDLHSAANVAKMHSGVPLDDSDRGPWLAAIGERIDAWLAAGACGVVACSALKRRYRAQLQGVDPESAARRGHVFVALLQAPKEALASRLATRKNHFMPKSLLDSQLATLEPISPGEKGAFSVDVSRSPEDAAQSILARLEP